MGFVDMSGSYQNGKGSNTEIDHISVFYVFPNETKQYIRITHNKSFSILAKLICVRCV